ncbi:MAG: hypothetical protein KA393_03860 [Limnohabitans sp.]|nr:hypothetical protein [Limnohabitans sp.]
MTTKKTDKPSLGDRVDSTLSAWEKWRGEVERSQHATPLQAIAVLLWLREAMGEPEGLTRKQIDDFAGVWLRKISEATPLRGGNLNVTPYRYLTPRDPLSWSALELNKGVQSGRGVMPPDGWVMKWAEFDYWFESIKGEGVRPFEVFFASATAEAGKSDEWDGERLLKRQTELKTQGAHAPTQALAKEAGISVKTVTNRIKAYKEVGSKTNIFADLFVVGNKLKR